MGAWRYKYIYSFLTAAIHEGKWTHYVRGLPPVRSPAVSIEIRGGMEARKIREVYYFCRESNNDFSVVQPVAWSVYKLSCPGFIRKISDCLSRCGVNLTYL